MLNVEAAAAATDASRANKTNSISDLIRHAAHHEQIRISLWKGLTSIKLIFPCHGLKNDRICNKFEIRYEHFMKSAIASLRMIKVYLITIINNKRREIQVHVSHAQVKSSLCFMLQHLSSDKVDSLSPAHKIFLMIKQHSEYIFA